MLCLCAPSTEIRTSLGTNTQPLFMLCHFHTFLFFFFFLKLYFHPNFQNSQHRWPQWGLQGLALGKVGLQELGPLCLPRFSLCNPYLSEEIPRQIWNAELAPLRAATALFLCRREMKMYLDDKLGDNLEKQRGFASQIKSQNEKTRLGITKTPLWRQSSHHPWTETRNSEPLVVILEISKPSRETKRWQNFPISHPLGVTVLQNSNKVVQSSLSPSHTTRIDLYTRFLIGSLHLPGASVATASVTYLNVKITKKNI